MDRPVIHFAHSNGFQAAVYSKIFAQLESEFDILHVDMFAHDPVYPVKNGWREQADQLIDFLAEKANGPVYGVGHSFGASITFMAAVKRPDLFHGVCLLEPILFNGLRGYIVALTKLLGQVDRFSPAGQTKNRRRTWPTQESAKAYFESKPLFNRFDQDCLDAYIKHGLVQNDDGFHLRYKVEQELAVFRTGPHHFDSYKGKLKEMPGLVVTAESHGAIPEPMINRFARQHNFERKIVAGGHMFPLENPIDTASLINRYHQSAIKDRS